MCEYSAFIASWEARGPHRFEEWLKLIVDDLNSHMRNDREAWPVDPNAPKLQPPAAHSGEKGPFSA